jgi:hypothetical protein
MYVYIYINVGEYTDCPVFDGLYEFCTTYTDIYIYIYIYTYVYSQKDDSIIYTTVCMCIYTLMWDNIRIVLFSMVCMNFALHI